MAKVEIVHTRTGRVRRATTSQARLLCGTGKWEYGDVEAERSTKPPAPDYGAMDYQTLRSEVTSRGLVAASRKREDLIHALKYRTRHLEA